VRPGRARSPSLGYSVEEETYRCFPYTAAAEEIGIYIIEVFMVVCKISMSWAGCKDMPK
jgi:hypothetical protein